MLNLTIMLRGVSWQNNSNGNNIKIHFESIDSNQQPIISYSVTIKIGALLRIYNRSTV